MNPDRFSRQANSILRRLAEFPGGKSVNIQARRLPRSTMHEPHTRFEFHEHTFLFEDAAGGEPPTLPPMHGGIDDIAITLEGIAACEAEFEQLVCSARTLLDDAGAKYEWDVRTHVRPLDEQGTRRRYRVTLFTDAPAPPPMAPYMQ